MDNSGDVTTALLGQLLAVQVATASTNRSTLQLPDLSTRPFSPSHSAVAVNILWFLSLACSLAAALCATLIQQWVRDYLQRIQRHTQPLRRARVRAFLFAGSEKWRMDQVVESIPPLLHMSLFLFFAGLFVFLSSLNKAVTGAVAAIVACFMCFYGFATFAPLLDPSAPFETPLSSILWRLILVLRGKLPHGFKDIGIYTTAMADLPNVRVRFAMHTPGDIEGAARQDAKALQWAYERITDDRELEPFVDGIPGFLSSADGYKTWRVASRLRGSTVWAVGNRLTVLLDGCLTSTPNFKRASICLDALFALCLYYPRYGVSLRDFSRQITTMVVWNNTFASKAICISVMSSHPFLLSHSRYLDIPQNIHELSQQADKAVREVDDLRRRLEETLQSPSGFDDKFVLVQLLRGYMDALQLAGAQLSAWADVVNSHSIILDMVPALSWYVSLPRDRYSITLRNVPSFEAYQSLQIYAHQILAYMRVTISPPLLDITTLPTLPERSSTWFPLFDPAVFSREEYKSLCRELKPLSSALNALGFKPTADQTMDNITQTRGPAVRPLHSQPGSSPPPLPLSFAGCGPFGSLALILQDCKDGCRVTSLLDFVATLKRYAPKAVEPFVITQTLDIVYPRQTTTLPEASQLLFVRALDEILTWEREAKPDKPCPFSDIDITRLVASLEHNLTHELSVRFAEDTFGSGIVQGLQSPGSELAIGMPHMEPSLTQDADKDIYNRSQEVYKYIVSQRKALRNRMEK
ncbi:hypothetical protein DXG01_003364 [Tephrocybe rancida]|nr:hypothetical protein DXG01_003364 [Tephrocybe rancida]